MTPFAVALDQVTPQFVDGVRAYIRMWRRASADGPFLITADNLFDVLVDLYSDVGPIIDGENTKAAGEPTLLSHAAMESESIKFWLRDTFFVPGPLRPTRRVRREAKDRHKFIASVIAAADPLGAKRHGFSPAPIVCKI